VKRNKFQTNFQPAGTAAAFQGSNLTDAGVRQIGQKTSQDVQALERVARSHDQAHSARIRDFKEKGRIEESARKEVKLFFDGVHENKMRQMALNQQSNQRNLDVELSNIKKASGHAEMLKNFSMTLATQAVSAYNEHLDGQVEQGYLEAQRRGLPTDLENNIQAARERELFLTDEKFERVEDIYHKKGASPSTIAFLKKGSAALNYGRLKAFSEMAGDGFGDWANTQMLERGLMTKTLSEKSAILDQLQKEYLQQNGLWGLNADFLQPALLKMKAYKNTVLKKADNDDRISINKDFQTGWNQMLLQYPTAETLDLWLRRTQRLQLTPDGSRLGISGAKTALFELLGDVKLISKYHVGELLRTPIRDRSGALVPLSNPTKERLEIHGPHETWASKFPSDVAALSKQRIETQTADTRLQKDFEKNKDAKQIKVAKDYLLNEWDPNNISKFDELVQELENAGVDPGLINEHIKPVRVGTPHHQNEQYWRTELQDLASTGRLSSTDLDNRFIPAIVRKEFKELAKEQDELRAKSSISEQTAKTSLGAALALSLGEESYRPGTNHNSHGLALDWAMRQWRQESILGQSTETVFKASQNSLLALTEAIQKKEGDFGVTATGAPGNETGRAYFSKFTPGTHVGAPEVIDTIVKRRDIIQQVANNPSVFDTELLTGEDQMKYQARRLRDNLIVQIPDVFYDIEKAGGKELKYGTAVDMYNRQLVVAGELDATGKKPLQLTQDPRGIMVRETDDPYIKTALTKIRTIEDAQRLVTSLLPSEQSSTPLVNHFISEINPRPTLVEKIPGFEDEATDILYHLENSHFAGEKFDIIPLNDPNRPNSFRVAPGPTGEKLRALKKKGWLPNITYVTATTEEPPFGYWQVRRTQ